MEKEVSAPIFENKRACISFGGNLVKMSLHSFVADCKCVRKLNRQLKQMETVRYSYHDDLDDQFITSQMF